jgi:hypothetical protein
VRIFRLLLPIAIVALTLVMPTPASAQVYISFAAPPLMPTYDQPPVSTQNAIWTPGYWAWGPNGYYWVPGTYVTPPSLGLLWTPGYWGMNTGGGGYLWNPGYWGSNVGYYGGVNYGGGYYGNGYVGGGWQGNVFRYNTAVTPVNTRYIRNVYVNKTVIVRNVNRYSYNGPGGVRMHPDARQITYARERHIAMTPVQRAHIAEAQQDRNMYAKVNNGKPAETVVARPLSTTNRPANFKPLTTADKTAAVKPVAKPATNAEIKPAAKPAAKPPEKMKPAAPPQAKPAGKTPQTKPAGNSPQAKPAAKPPSGNKPPAQSAGKPPSGNKPPAQPAGKPSQGQPDKSSDKKPPA